MDKKDNGGPAYPAPGMTGYEKDGVVTFVNWPGMTLRDYFAAKAMAALFDSDAGHSPAECTLIASEAYDMADAMLNARKPTPAQP